MRRQDETTMHNAGRDESQGERGSALIIAILIAVILSLLGISYLLMAQTENTIAENERNAAMALYVAETGARLTVAWFNDPTSTGYLLPTTGQITRTLRLLDHDNNAGTARVLASSGDVTKPLYKDSATTLSSLFDRPYRSAMGDTFLGIETGTDPDPSFATSGPDLVVSASHLATINNALFPNFPSSALRARIARIEVYAPPTLIINGAATRMGIATVKVTGGVFQFPGTAEERQIATRVVKALVNEIPVPGPGGPLQSCASLSYTGNFQIHWGAGSSVSTADLGLTSGNVTNKVPTGMPYANNDPNSYYADLVTPMNLGLWAAAHNNEFVDDPWFRFMAGGALASISGFAPAPTEPQPWKYVTPNGSTTTDLTNLFQNTPLACPTFDYNLWKSIAQSGGKNHWYYRYDSGDNFRQDGTGTPMTFETATGSKTGVFFFDTVDSLPPNGLAYTDALSNLTPYISISNNAWGTQGFLYINAKRWASFGTGTSGITRTILPPGEPGDASGFVNFDYPGSFGGNIRIKNGTVNFETFQDPITGDWWCTDAQQCDATARVAAAAPVRDNYGLPFQDKVVVDGVLYTSGVFEAAGNGTYFGSVVAQQGVIDAAGTPSLYFDESLVKGNWPRKGMNMPRVVVSSWQTDL